MQSKLRKHLTGSLLVCTILTLLIFSGFNAVQAESEDDYRQIEDMTGRELEIPRKVERVIAIGPGSLRHIVHLQAEDRVVGIEEGEVMDEEGYYRDYRLAHPELEDLPVIGPDHGGDPELIARQEPDLIVFYGDPGDAATLQEKTETPTVIVDFGDHYGEKEKLQKSWKLLGEIFDRNERAEKLSEYLEEILADLEARTEDISAEERATVFAGGISFRGSHGLTSTRVPFEPLDFINAPAITREVIEDEDGQIQVMFDREQLLLNDPDKIFIDSGNFPLVVEDFERYDEYSTLSAVQEGRTYTILPYSDYHRQTSSILGNAYYAGSIIYPERFSDVDPESRVEEIMEKFLGEPVYDELSDFHRGFGSVDLLEK
ncbi:ABC transporter substrate-binding protein [Halarsenatibacter silvermanii]|uniref:Iron complex transport system substrate-binding protein n=1 Tax=Halarsenatibacter silvermanii TaxID=321763 RepID=A0A1G9TL94_9FIRM|nr:ABC transporter substrate-binding protein [Halarsenatibacter silvermanii]SDM48443.1 iron complex transport system substrate-binding protein [Halarsenatibacter silvermanii]